MKRYPLNALVSLILVAACLCVTEGFGQSREKRVNLGGNWKFILGDNMKFAKPEHNDSDWEEMYVPAAWQDEGFRHYHGYAWYRRTFTIEFTNKDALYLELGKIDDVDEVYLNGQLVGKTGGFPPDYFTAYDYPRRYFLPAELLKNGGKNVLAVRIFDEGGAGGITQGSGIGIYSYQNFSENSINLFGKWKFRLFDNEEWSRESIDESEWDDVIVPASWESQGYGNYDGIAWYRKTFKLPANFKASDLVLLLGKIDDHDEVFVNGKLIGSTGTMKRRPGGSEEYARYRTYPVPDDVLKPGKNNVIAVRVFDMIGAGGIYAGPIALLPRNEYKEFWKKYRNDNFDFNHWMSYFFD